MKILDKLLNNKPKLDSEIIIEPSLLICSTIAT